MITFQQEQTLYKRAIEKWGELSQIDMMIEEMSELITALSHLKRGRTNNVNEEVADVMIVTGQARFMFDSVEIDRIKQEKLERLKGLLE